MSDLLGGVDAERRDGLEAQSSLILQGSKGLADLGDELFMPEWPYPRWSISEVECPGLISHQFQRIDRKQRNRQRIANAPLLSQRQFATPFPVRT